MFDEYTRIAGKDITESIKSEMSGDLEDALLAIGESLIWAEDIKTGHATFYHCSASVACFR